MKRTIVAALAGFGVAVLLGVPAPIATPARGELRAAASGSEPGRYVFLPFRQRLWAIDKKGSVLLYYKLPGTNEVGVMKSRLQPFDADRFPPAETEYLLSAQNLTDFLWICNTVTGDVQVMKYDREGAFDTQYAIPTGKDFQLPTGTRK
ncbi:MAG: hypothetical protein JXP34_04880 [Planctomycetes bacterium]|nr:hypothetical protein [Planctomycetota bacterium]